MNYNKDNGLLNMIRTQTIFNSKLTEMLVIGL